MKTRKVATFILYDKRIGKFLFQEKSDYKGANNGKISLFGGGLEDKETYLQGVKREAMEELCYKLKAPKLFYKEKNIVDDVSYTANIYVAKYDTAQKLTPNFETKRLLWLRIDQVFNFKMGPHRRKFFEENQKKFERLV
jgi:8-oxo-dGTP pyrophosphatase MutT (NUDIX family)